MRLPKKLKKKMQLLRSLGDGGAIPSTWCGSERYDNDIEHETALDLPKFKFVYAYAADQPNRVATIGSAIQAATQMISGTVAEESGFRKSPRFDFGTSCGADYLDIMSYRLSKPLSYYQASNTTQGLSEENKSISRAAGASNLTRPRGLNRNIIIVIDGARSDGSIWGFGGMHNKAVLNVPGAENVHNRGFMESNIAVPLSVSNPDGDRTSLARVILHEMGHNLGAVSSQAPNSNDASGEPRGYAHCHDGLDIMCYNDGGPLGRQQLVCGKAFLPIDVSFDCNKDDYFSPNPAPGTYLSTHWNTYNSVFLAPCSENEKVCALADMHKAKAVWSPLLTRRTIRKGPLKESGALLTLASIEMGRLSSVSAFSLDYFQVPRGKWIAKTCLRRFSAKKLKVYCIQEKYNFRVAREAQLPYIEKKFSPSVAATITATGWIYNSRTKRKLVLNARPTATSILAMGG